MLDLEVKLEGCQEATDLFKDFKYEYVSEKVCMTKDGPQPEKVCIFPFTFKGITYYECANAGIVS